MVVRQRYPLRFFSFPSTPNYHYQYQWNLETIVSHTSFGDTTVGRSMRSKWHYQRSREFLPSIEHKWLSIRGWGSILLKPFTMHLGHSNYISKKSLIWESAIFASLQGIRLMNTFSKDQSSIDLPVVSLPICAAPFPSFRARQLGEYTRPPLHKARLFIDLV